MFLLHISLQKMSLLGYYVVSGVIHYTLTVSAGDLYAVRLFGVLSNAISSLFRMKKNENVKNSNVSWRKITEKSKKPKENW